MYLCTPYLYPPLFRSGQLQWNCGMAVVRRNIKVVAPDLGPCCLGSGYASLRVDRQGIDRTMARRRTNISRGGYAGVFCRTTGRERRDEGIKNQKSRVLCQACTPGQAQVCGGALAPMDGFVRTPRASAVVAIISVVRSNNTLIPSSGWGGGGRCGSCPKQADIYAYVGYYFTRELSSTDYAV